jgi:hypothetical protein
MQNQNYLNKMHASLTKNRQMPHSQKYIKTIAMKRWQCPAMPDLRYLILLVSVRRRAALGKCDV